VGQLLKTSLIQIKIMKRILILIFVVITVSSFAQVESVKNKNGKPILPLEGEIGLGVNAIPLLNWVGNSFNNTTDNLYANQNKLYNLNGFPIVLLKYMKTNTLAYRFSFGYSNFTGTDNQYILDNASNDADIFLIDSRQTSYNGLSLGIGFEKRKGRGRIQGFYGAGLRYQSIKMVNDIYSYGNNLTITNQNPTTFDWSTNTILNLSDRILETRGGNSFTLGLRPFIGVEVFVSPQIALGTEFGWYYAYQRIKETSIYTEYFSASSNEVIYEEKPQSAGSTSFSSQLDNFNSSIFLTFYF